MTEPGDSPLPVATTAAPLLASAADAVDAVAAALAVQATAAAVSAPPTSASTGPAGAEEDPLALLARLAPPERTEAGAAPAARPGPTTPRPVESVPPTTRPHTRFWRIGFPALMVCLTLLIPVLLYAGRKTVLQSTDGKLVTSITDPAAPGWRALTDPTPTLLLVQTDAEGKANSLTVMSLTGDGAGALVFVPMTTVLQLADLGTLPLNAVADKAGLDGLQKATEGVLGAGMQDIAVVTPAQWADLVAPVAPLTVMNPDDVTVANEAGARKVIFPKGALNLEAKDVATYLATANPGENDLNRLVRHKAFWEAWLRKVGVSADANVVPGETTSGLGRYIRTLATSRVEMDPLPVQSAGIPNSTALVYVPVADQVQGLVAKVIPFPVGAPAGARARVRLLDGVGTLDHGVAAAPLVVEGGGQIDQIGNADAFGVATTQLLFSDEARRPDVEKLQAALGVGELVLGAPGASDVTIVLGQDYAAQPARSLTTVGAAPSGTATTMVVGLGGG